MTARQRACRIHLWLTDGQYEHLLGHPDDGWSWRWRRWLEIAGVWLLCRVAGHQARRTGNPEATP